MRFPPIGYDAIVQTYGDAAAFHDRQALWEETILRYLAVPEGMFLWLGKPIHSIRVHNLAAPAFGKVINTLWNGNVEGVEYGGTYAYRLNRNNPQALSVHAWGIAIDLNPTKCPNGGNPALQDSRLVAAFRDADFTWGGTFHHPDGQHFQLCGGY